MGQKVSVDDKSPYQVSIPGQGKLTGYTLLSQRTGNKSSHRFAKVPYGLPCSGNFRFRLPRPIPDDFDYTGDYKEFGLRCPQPLAPHQLPEDQLPSDENINYLNIWVPSSNRYKPKEGWPVFIYIHGGLLQYSDPNNQLLNTSELFDDEEFEQKFILVCPGYRLNIFGFLSCKELLEENPRSSNFGFWDQRLAIEWCYKYIKFFGGNPQRITLGGLSAGAHSTFFQLSYELYHPEVTQIIKQVVFLSNMDYVQPKTIEDSQEQFDEIIDALGISKDLPSSHKLEALRDLDPSFIEKFIPTIKFHLFRAVTDGNFIYSHLIRDIEEGDYATKLKKKGVRMICGEVENEALRYSLMNTPTTFEQLSTEVANLYPEDLIPVLFDLYDVRALDPNDPHFKTKLKIIYGAIVSDGQVYASERGYLYKLVANGFPKENIFRYRVAFRGKWLDKYVDPCVSVPHGCDLSIWFYSLREGYTEEERNYANSWLIPYLRFLNFHKDLEDWKNDDITKFRLFKKDGSVAYTEDLNWKWGTKVADVVYKIQSKQDQDQ